MSKVYDNNWERLVEATLKTENLRQIVDGPSFRSSICNDSGEIYPFVSDVRGYLERTVLLADEIIKAADTAATFKLECIQLQSKTRQLAGLLRQGMDLRIDLYEHLTRRVIVKTERVLLKALTLVMTCRGLLKRVFNIITNEAFRKISFLLENSINDVYCLVRIFASLDDPGYNCVALHPTATNDPILCIIRKQIAILCAGSTDNRSDAAVELVLLLQYSQKYRKLIVEEGGVVPLLKLLEEGESEGQENAARAIGLLGKDPETIEHMIDAGVCLVFAKILKEGAMKVQAVVAWAVSELASYYPKCQDLFAQHNIVMLLVRHLAFKTLQVHRLRSSSTSSVTAAVILPNNNNDHSDAGENDSVTKGTNVDDESHTSHVLKNKPSNQIQNVVTSTMVLEGGGGVMKSNGNDDAMLTSVQDCHHQQTLTLFGASDRAREMEDPVTKAKIKAMAARALGCLARRNSSICRSITESIALLCFAVLLEKGPEEVQHNCAIALLEITAVAEEDSDLRTSAFKPDSPISKAVVDQLFLIIEKADNSELFVPCVKVIGNLSTTFRETGKRMVNPLLKLLNHQKLTVSVEASIALKKFARSMEHSKAIIIAGGAEHIIRRVYFGDQIVHGCAMQLMRRLALHVPDMEELAQEEVSTVLQWAEKHASLMHDKELEEKLRVMYNRFRR